MKLNLIVTTLNGYVIERTRLMNEEDPEVVLDRLLTEKFRTNKLGVFNYGDDLMGDGDQLELFIMNGNNKQCDDRYSNSKPYTFMEDWLTDTTGQYEDFYVGLEIPSVRI